MNHAVKFKNYFMISKIQSQKKIKQQIPFNKKKSSKNLYNDKTWV